MKVLMRTSMLVAVSLVLSSGCQKLNYERDETVSAGGTKAIIIDAPRSDQNVSVNVVSPGAPVSVYVVLEKDQSTVEQSVLNHAKLDGSKILGSKEKSENATVEATVPAKNGYVILLSNDSTKPATVKVKITGK